MDRKDRAAYLKPHGPKYGVQDSKKLPDLADGFAGRWGGVVKSKFPGSLRLRIRIEQRQEVSKLPKNSFQIRDLTLRGFLECPRTIEVWQSGYRGVAESGKTEVRDTSPEVTIDRIRPFYFTRIGY